MELWVSKVFRMSLLLTIAFCGNINCETSDKEVMAQYKQHMSQIAQSRQFIGSSVIGGLMWPILLTLAVTATMARIPDFLQRLLTGVAGGGGGTHRINYRSKRSKIPDVHLDEIVNLLGQSISNLEYVLSQEIASEKKLYNLKTS